MANKKISELQSRTPALSDLILVGDPSSGYSYKCTVTALATIIETDIADGFVTIGTTQTISGAKTFSNNLTLTSVANTPTDPDKFLTLNASNVVTYRTGAEVLSDIGGQGALTLTTTGTSGAATLVGSTLNIPQYQSVLTNPVTGTGTTNYIPKFTSSSAIGNSQIFDNGTNVGIGTSSPSATLDVRTTSGSLSLRSQSNDGTAANNAGFLVYNTASATAATRVTQLVLDPSGANASGTDYFVMQSYGDGKTDLLNTKSDGYLTFGTANTERMRLDASGNLGLGVTPSAWQSTRRALEIRGSSATGSMVLNTAATSQAVLGANYYFDGTNFFYQGSSFASYYQQLNGQHQWWAAPSGTAAATATFTQAMTLDASGNLGIGTTSPNVSSFSKALTISSANSGIELTSATNVVQATVSSNTAGLLLQGIGTDGMRFSTSASGATSERMRITSGGNVGIGTSTPNSITGYTVLTINGNTTGSILDLDVSDARTGSFIASSSQLNIGSITNIPFVFLTNNAERMRITSDGSVGIGTTNPLNLLHINGADPILLVKDTETGAALADARLRLAESGAAGALGEYWDIHHTGTSLAFTRSDYGEVARFSTTGELLIGTTSDAGDFKLQVNGNVYAAGNVGIGTTSPSTKLHIVDTNPLVLGESTGSLTVTYETGTTAIGQGGGIFLGIPASVNSFLSTYIKAARESANSANSAAALVFGTRINGGSNTERMRITSGGNVGIGTTSPVTNLQVHKTTTGLSGVQVTNSTTGSTIIDGTFFGIDDSQSYVWNYENTPTSFATNNTERMRITSGGNVGIGTTSPIEKLQVTGNVLLNDGYKLYGNSNSGSTSSYVSLYNTTDGGIDLMANFSTSKITFGTAAAERMRITSGGNVLVGTTTDAGYKLDVSGSFSSKTSGIYLQYNSGILYHYGGSGNYYQYISGANYLLSNRTATGALVFNTVDTERMRITSGGELLINTTTDAGDFKLQVNGNSYFNGSATINATTGNNDLVFLATTRPSIFVNSTNIGLQIRTNGTGVLELNGDNSATGDVNINNALIYVDASASNVGIGTNAPSAKLEVNGAIKTAAPSGGTAKPWKLGSVVASSVTYSSTNYVEVEIDGVFYKLALAADA